MKCQYLYRVLVALDRLCNALLNGRDTETMSSRVYRNSVKGYWYAKVAEVILNFIFSPWGADHCKTSYENERDRVNVPEVDAGDDVSGTGEDG